MSKHTPGPWAVDLAAETVTGSNGNIVVYEMNTNEADAILIAAAPDLLEACVQAMQDFDNAKYAEDMSFAWAAEMTAAIAKATGSAA